MKYALCLKLSQHDFTIVIVHKLFMATVRNLACIAFRPEALDVHSLIHRFWELEKLALSKFAEVELFTDF